MTFPSGRTDTRISEIMIGLDTASDYSTGGRERNANLYIHGRRTMLLLQLFLALCSSVSNTNHRFVEKILHGSNGFFFLNPECLNKPTLIFESCFPRKRELSWIMYLFQESFGFNEYEDSHFLGER